MTQKIPSAEQKSHFVFFVPALVMAACAEELGTKGFLLGGQNCHFEEEGAFTGENSPKTLKTLGAGACLVGHSERRTLFLEDEALICQKVKALLKNRLCPVLCVGESRKEKARGHSFEVVARQLRTALPEGLVHQQPPPPQQEGDAGAKLAGFDILVAYEPVWAIGTGQRPTLSDIEKMVHFIQSQTSPSGLKVGVLYGGSVKKKSIGNLRAVPGLKGVLVGGASLDPVDFASLLTPKGKF